MVALAEAHPRVGIVGSYYGWGHSVAGLGLDAQRNVFSGKETCRRFLLDGVFPFGSPSTVMYRACLVRAHTPFYIDGHLHEDTEAALRLLKDHDFGFVHQILTFLRFQEESITYASRDFDREALDGLIVVKQLGRLFLDGSEYDAVLKRVMRSFYRGLAKQWSADVVLRPILALSQGTGHDREKLRADACPTSCWRGVLEAIIAVLMRCARSKHCFRRRATARDQRPAPLMRPVAPFQSGTILRFVGAVGAVPPACPAASTTYSTASPLNGGGRNGRGTAGDRTPDVTALVDGFVTDVQSRRRRKV